jgi:hypothetical protein
MSERDPLFLAGLGLVVILDVLLVYIVLGLPGVLVGAIIVHLGVARIERRREREVTSPSRAVADAPR